jgi:heme O synthase-like polyprenyltransferase
VLTAAVTVMFGAAAELNWLYFSVAAVGGAGFIALAWRLLRGGSELPLWRYSTLYLAALFAAMVADQLLLG